MVLKLKTGDPKEKKDIVPVIVIAVIALIGLATAILPRVIFLRNEYSPDVDMPCVLTENIELFLGVLITVFAIQYLIRKTLKGKFIYSLIIIFFGVLVILFPVLFTGLCDDPDMACRQYILPTLIILGVLTIIFGVIAGRLSPRAVKNDPEKD